VAAAPRHIIPPVDVVATKRSLLLLAAATDRGFRATPTLLLAAATDRGFRATPADTSAALGLIRTLESATPTPAPTRALDLLCGDWKLLYTTARDVLSLATPATTPKRQYERKQR